jgi:L-asparaginase II
MSTRDGATVTASSSSLTTTRHSATDAFEAVAKTLALACESKTKGERERAKLIAEPVLKQYLAELDEMQAILERMEDTGGSRDGDPMET